MSIHLISFSLSDVGAQPWPGPSPPFCPSAPPSLNPQGSPSSKGQGAWADEQRPCPRQQGLWESQAGLRAPTWRAVAIMGGGVPARSMMGSGLQTVIPGSGSHLPFSFPMSQPPQRAPEPSGPQPSILSTAGAGWWSSRGSRVPLELQPPPCLLALQQDPGEDGQPSVEPEHHAACHGEPPLAAPGPRLRPPPHPARFQGLWPFKDSTPTCICSL